MTPDQLSLSIEHTSTSPSIYSLQPTAATDSAEPHIPKLNTTEHSLYYLAVLIKSKKKKEKKTFLLTLASGDEVNGRLSFVCEREGWRQ